MISGHRVPFSHDYTKQDLLVLRLAQAPSAERVAVHCKEFSATNAVGSQFFRHVLLLIHSFCDLGYKEPCLCS